MCRNAKWQNFGSHVRNTEHVIFLPFTIKIALAISQSFLIQYCIGIFEIIFTLSSSWLVCLFVKNKYVMYWKKVCFLKKYEIHA